MFIQLTQPGGHTIVVNTDNVEWVGRHADGQTAVVRLISGIAIDVSEKYDKLADTLFSLTNRRDLVEDAPTANTAPSRP